MGNIYKRAQKGLVLDSSLECVDLSSICADEILMRISCAPWCRRLWTLQEAVLSKDLVFQYSGKAVKGDDIFNLGIRLPTIQSSAETLRFFRTLPPWDPQVSEAPGRVIRLAPSHSPEILDVVLHEKIHQGFINHTFTPEFAGESYSDAPTSQAGESTSEFIRRVDFYVTLLINSTTKYSIPKLQAILTATDIVEIDMVMEAVCCRQTSRPEDETICIATIRGLDSATIQLVPRENTEEGMKLFLLLCRNLSSKLVFCPRPRLLADGFG